MSDPLIVPMVVEALVVNDAVRAPNGIQTFQRMTMQYEFMSDLSSGALSGAAGSWPTPSGVTTSQYYDGVYLKWRLPRAFTQGAHDPRSGSTRYPPVPNRWLVLRYGGELSQRIATAWIVESDYVWSEAPSPANASQLGSLYLQSKITPESDTAVTVLIGRRVPLDEWTEPGTSLGLTAMAPGNPAFAFYQPTCNNVFSFIDPLVSAGIAGPMTLSYMVLGWFSDPADDPLAGPEADFAQRLAHLGWLLPPVDGPQPVARWSLLYGTVCGVAWQTTSLPPGGTAGAASTPLSVAVGNTAVEALTALVTAQAASSPVPLEPELLEAFQLDAVDVLDQPDGAGRLAEKLQASFFQKYSGGYTWTIVDAPTGSDVVPPPFRRPESDWLAELERAQQQLDAALLRLQSLRTELYQSWWKYMICVQSTSAPAHQQEALRDAIDPAVAGSLAARVVRQLAAVRRLQAFVPTGATAEELRLVIERYAARHGLAPDRRLKRAAAPRFYLPNNPVVLIAGAGASGIVPAPDQILCRFPGQLVGGFVYDGNPITPASAGVKVPLPHHLAHVTGVPWTPELAAALIEEFFLTDPNNATMVAAALGSSDVAGIAAAMSPPETTLGVYPAGAVSQWTANPWHPLLLKWEANYYPLPYGTTEEPNWIFADGQYTWNGRGADGGQTVLGLSGVIQLTPAAVFNMEARLQAFLANNPNLPPQQEAAFAELLQQVQNEDAWDLLSQALDGFNQQLQLGQPGVFMGPSSTPLHTQPPLAELLGDVGSYPPDVPLPPEPGQQLGPDLFQPWRAGQFAFVDLMVVDEWGQALNPIDGADYEQVSLFLPPELEPVLVSTGAPFTVVADATVGALVPALASVGASDLELTVEGVGFDASAQVEWTPVIGSPSSTTLTPTSVSPTRLTVSVPPDLLAAAGAATVTVTGADGSLTFTIVDGPAIGALVPSLAQAGMASSALLPIAVEGAGFAAGAVVQWNGTPLATTFVGAKRLIAELPASFIAAAATAAVTVISGGVTTAAATFTVSAGAAVGSLEPSLALAGATVGPDLAVRVYGVGFSPASAVQWTPPPPAQPLAVPTTFVSETELVAQVPVSSLVAGTYEVSESVGSTVTAGVPLIQLPPALLQPARLRFDLLSTTGDHVPFGPANPGADPICGWLLPNHLDGSLMAYDPAGKPLGEMAVGMPTSGPAAVCWTPAPGSAYGTLQELAAAVPHFGPFLAALAQRRTETFAAFLAAVDESLWTTVPMGAVFDRSLTTLVGRPLAMVRASLQLQLDGPPCRDPSWQPTAPPVTSFQLSIELGNLAQLDDGLIGYFAADDYATFNVVAQAGAAADDYLRTIGADGNYLYAAFDGGTSYVSMLVDPRAGVHATTAILPTAEVTLPAPLVDAALAAMDVTFRVGALLTDQRIAAPNPGGGPFTTLLMPVPQAKGGSWSWLEQGADGWTSYPIAPADARAQLSDALPMLRRGLLRLAAALEPKTATPRRDTARRGKEKTP